MDSRKFIKDAAPLIEEIEANQQSLASQEVRGQKRDGLQGEINRLFGTLYNPTLPSAFRLRDVALRAGYQVNPEVLRRLRDHEFLAG